MQPGVFIWRNDLPALSYMDLFTTYPLQLINFGAFIY